MTVRLVAVLFARADSIYKTLEGCDVWDMDRDARKFPGGMPVVGHPPCRAWGSLAHMATRATPEEKALAPWCVDRIREEGGVLEHPAGSRLWKAKGLPGPAEGADAWGGWTLAAPQIWWGHGAYKATKFYICGLTPAELPEIPFHLGYPTHYIKRKQPGLLRIRCDGDKKAVESTPPALAEWLVELARRTRKPRIS